MDLNVNEWEDEKKIVEVERKTMKTWTTFTKAKMEAKAEEEQE